MGGIGPGRGPGKGAPTPVCAKPRRSLPHPRSPEPSPPWAVQRTGRCGRPCSAKPQRPCTRRGGGAGPRAREAGAPGRGRGGLAPPAAGALPGRGDAGSARAPRSPGFSAPRPRLPVPSAAPPAAGSSSPCLPSFALSPLTFPSPGRRRRAPRQPRAHCGARTAGQRGRVPCPLPAPLARSGENGTMPGAGDRGAARARWLGAALLGKAAPARSLLPRPKPQALPAEEGTLGPAAPGPGWAGSAAGTRAAATSL